MKKALVEIVTFNVADVITASDPGNVTLPCVPAEDNE